MLLWEFHIMCLIPVHFSVLPYLPPPKKRPLSLSITYWFIVVLLGAAVCRAVYPSAKVTLLVNVHCSRLLVWFKPIPSILDPHWDFPLLSCYYPEPWRSWGCGSTVLVPSCTTTGHRWGRCYVKVGLCKALDVGLGGNWAGQSWPPPGTPHSGEGRTRSPVPTSLRPALPEQARGGVNLAGPSDLNMPFSGGKAGHRHLWPWLPSGHKHRHGSVSAQGQTPHVLLTTLISPVPALSMAHWTALLLFPSHFSTRHLFIIVGPSGGGGGWVSGHCLSPAHNCSHQTGRPLKQLYFKLNERCNVYCVWISLVKLATLNYLPYVSPHSFFQENVYNLFLILSRRDIPPLIED